MTDFNLPPGCRVSDIPGNRPEDLEEEMFWDALQTVGDAHSGVKFPEDWQDDEGIRTLIVFARDLGMSQGFAEGRDETLMDIGAREIERAEQEQNER